MEPHDYHTANMKKPLNYLFFKNSNLTLYDYLRINQYNQSSIIKSLKTKYFFKEYIATFQINDCYKISHLNL